MTGKANAERAYAPDEVFVPGERIETGRLEGILGFHLKMASVALYHHYNNAMSETGLTQKQFAVMELIAQNPGASQIDIAGQLSMDRATMMALINRLESRTLLERRPSPFDRRKQQLFLTEVGHALLGESRTTITAHEEVFTQRFTQEELDLFFSYLRRVYFDEHGEAGH